MLKVAGGAGGGTGTVTQINTGEGLTGGPITSSGTIALVVPVSIADGGTNSTATPTSGAVAYGNGTSYLFTAAGTAGQYLQSTGSGAPTWSTPSTGSFQPAYYGTFVSTSSQTNAGATSANAVNFDTVVLASGISITSSNQITFANAGQYIIAFELAVNNSVGSNPTISSWLALNGTNIANTRSDMTIQGGSNNPQLLEQQWIVNVTAGQYIQIYWSCSATTVSLLYTAAGASPTRPAGPSAIVNCAFIPPSGQNVVINSSTITGGTGGYILYDNAGTIGEKAVSGTGNVVLVTSSTLSNVNISSVAVTFPNSYLANSTATLGNATITLGGTTTSVGNLTLANANITSVAATFPNSYLANSTATLGNATITLGSTTSTVGNLTLNNVTIGSGNSTITTENASYINVSTAIRTQALTGYLYGNANTGNVTAATTIPNAGLANSTATLGNATITLGSTTTTVGNLTLQNVTISNVASTFPNSFLANSTATLGNATVTLGSTTSTVGNLTLTLPTVTNYLESQVAIGNSGTAQTLSLASGTVQTVTLTGNCTFTMPAVGSSKSFVLLINTGAGGFTATFTSVKWPANTAPTITTTASRWDIISFVSDGTNWYGNFAQGYA
jgi:hypothetical protein